MGMEMSGLQSILRSVCDTYAGPGRYLQYSVFWLSLLGFKLWFSYEFQIYPLMAPTHTILSSTKMTVAIKVALVFCVWIPVLFIYFIDLQIWHFALIGLKLPQPCCFVHRVGFVLQVLCVVLCGRTRAWLEPGCLSLRLRCGWSQVALALDSCVAGARLS